MHVRSKHEDALPLIVTHGWPGSIIEQLKIVDPLTNPTAHGGERSGRVPCGDPVDAGLRILGKPASTGWGPERMGRAWAELMTAPRLQPLRRPGRRLGRIRRRPDGVAGTCGTARHPHQHAGHRSRRRRQGAPGRRPAAARSLGRGTTRLRAAGTDLQAGRLRQVTWRSRPQTLYGIADSPVGLAAWLLDHNDADGQPAAAVASALNRTTSATGELTRDEILDNITLYWLTNTGVSASRLYWEYKGGFFNAKGVAIPVAVSVFPGEQYQAPRSWTERAYPNLIYFNEVDKGGHFAAWEQPQLFAEEIRAGFRSLRHEAVS